MSSRLVTYISCSPKFFTFFIFIEQLVSCEKNLDTNDFLRTIKNLDLELIGKIEERVGLKINSIEEILLKGANNDKITTITEITKVVAEKVLEQIEQHPDEEYGKHGVKKNITSVIVPSNFLCAMLAIHEILQRVFKNHVNPHRIPISRLKIYEMLDNVLKRSPTKFVHLYTRMNAHEFTILMKSLGPHLSDELVEKVASHELPEYYFADGKGGTPLYFFDRVIKDFYRWTKLLKGGEEPFFVDLKNEIEQEYGSDRCEAVIEELSLILCRDYHLGNTVKYNFWIFYVNRLMLSPQEDLDSIFDFFFVNGWYYEVKNVEYFNLFTRVLRRIESLPQQVVLKYQPLMHNRTVGVPQLWPCNQTKTSFEHFS